MLRNISVTGIMALIMVLVISCAAINPQVRVKPGEPACLLFGYIDMTGSGDALQEVMISS